MLGRKANYKQGLTGVSRLDLKVPGRLLSQLAATGRSWDL